RALALLARAHLLEPPVPDQDRSRGGPGGVQRVQRSCDEQIGHRETSGRVSRYMRGMDERHHLDGRLLAALGAAALLGIFFWNTWPLYPFKLLVVLMHESGHAAATLLAGGSVDRIAISPDQGGVTFSRIQPTLLREVLVSSAGYIGSTVSGCVLLWIAARSKEGRWPLIALAGWCALVTVLYVRDGFTLVFVGGCALALGLL